MKNILFLSLVFFCLNVQASVNPDSVIMTVNGKPISLAEFEFIAGKNNEVDFTDKHSVEKYVELFKNFKLKVAAAEALELDKNKDFEDELSGYRVQLLAGYLSDKEAEEAYAKQMYDRQSEILDISHILFKLPEKTISRDTISVYNQACKIYERLAAGEDFELVAKELADFIPQDGDAEVIYQRIPDYSALTWVKAFDDAAYSLTEGDISRPVRTSYGFHVIKLHERRPDPGMVQVAQILISVPENNPDGEQKALQKAEAIYQKAIAGEDFTSLAQEYSEDDKAAEGGILPPFGLGKVVRPFEDAVFALKNPGDISKPVKTTFGYHIIRLIDKKAPPSFDSRKNALISALKQDEHNFGLQRSYDERLKKEYGYVFYPESYAELQKLCDNHFPSDPDFFEEAQHLDKTLLKIGDIEIPQNEFAYYVQRNPFSVKTYSGDFMQEVYDLFVRDILTNMERKNLLVKYPEITHLMQEYRDGMLLFEISNQEIWSKPVEEQAGLENIWLEELNKKYPVEINWELVKKINKK